MPVGPAIFRRLFLKVLIIHPDAQQRAFLRACLAQGEYELHDCETVEKAAEIVNAPEGPVQLILAPYELQDGDGVALINALLATDLPAYPYILFTTDEGRRKNVIDSLGPIPGDFVLEPILEEELLARMQIAERTIALQTRLNSATGHSESLALYDSLTSVLNRQAVYERSLSELNRAQREGIPLSLAMLEISNLAAVREEYGADVRDQAVRFVARAARANVRIYDVVGRWIGAKFLIMLPGAQSENARAVAERIARAITTIRIRTPDSGRLQLDVRLGFTTTERADPQPLYVLIEQANRALETAQGEGAEYVVQYQPGG